APPVILGHGIGALIVMEFTKHHGAFCKAAVLSAPCLELQHPVPLFSLWLIKLMAEAVPRLRLPANLLPRFSQPLPLTLDAESTGAKGGHFPRLTAVFASELLLAIKRAEAR